MAALDTGAILQDGAVLTKPGQIVDLEPDGDLELFFMSKVHGVLDEDRAVFGTKQERDEALLRTVRLYLGEGWTLLGEES